MKLKKTVSAYCTSACEDMKRATGIIYVTLISSAVGPQWFKVFLFSFACYINSHTSVSKPIEHPVLLVKVNGC
jgi:hypothetical protein